MSVRLPVRISQIGSQLKRFSETHRLAQHIKNSLFSSTTTLRTDCLAQKQHYELIV